MIKQISSYDLMRLPIKYGQIYYVTESRVLYKDCGGSLRQRRRIGCVVVNSDYERTTKLKPVNGQNYYVVDSNMLWTFDTKWILKDGDIRQYNMYSYGNGGGITPVITSDPQIYSEATGDRIIDNNGLRGDGSVSVRDMNRIERAQIAFRPEHQDIAVYGKADEGISIIPYGAYGSEYEQQVTGSLHLGTTTEFNSGDFDTEVVRKGRAEYYGDLVIYGNIIQKIEQDTSTYAISRIPSIKPREEMLHKITCQATRVNADGTKYNEFTKITISDITEKTAKTRIQTFSDVEGIVSSSSQSNFTNSSLQLDSDITYDTARTIVSVNEVKYVIQGLLHEFTIEGLPDRAICTFSNPEEYVGSATEASVETTLYKTFKLQVSE